MKYFFFALLMMWICSSCTSSNIFDEGEGDIVYPDTTVEINSLTPQICKVNIKSTDSTYLITAYRTDKLTGRIIYKMEDNPYKNSRLHGVKFEYDADGDTLLIAHFEDGVRVDSTVYRYPNGQAKHKFFYSSAKDGNIAFEIQFHENGQRKTDLIAYEDGLLNGAVDYYDSTKVNDRTETFYYRENELIGIKIYNKKYDELDRRKNKLLREYQADSTRIANLLLAEANSNGFRNDVPVFYIGTEKDGMYDLGKPDDWDIMKIDPTFMLKYHNR